MCEGEISIEQLSESLDLFICLWGLFGFFCPFFHFPSRADWIILSTGSRISVGSLLRICSPRTDGLEERMWEERRGEERERYELVNVQTSLGSGGVHIVDSLLVITTVTFLAVAFHALVGAWCTIRPCVTPPILADDVRPEENKLWRHEPEGRARPPVCRREKVNE